MAIEPPRLGGGLTPTQWLRDIAAFDRQKGARMRAREAETIADWIEELQALANPPPTP